MIARLRVSWLILTAGLAGPNAGAGSPQDRPTAEARAVAFLTREVPRWSRENHCYSCHNNGDAARALYQAARAGYPVPPEALAETNGWLSRPSGWDQNGGDGPFSDKRLARVVFTTTLSTAVRTGAIPDRGELLHAAERLARDQGADGSWPLEGEDAPGSPAAYSRTLATFLARDSLAAAHPVRFRAAVERANAWLAARAVVTVTDASVRILADAEVDSPSAAARRRAALSRLFQAQADEGGWGPYTTSPPESFDTALALLALARSPRTEEVRHRIARGRRFLVAQQQADGGWIETTRPRGGESYAQRISTTGWATLALLATADPAPAPPERSAPVPPSRNRPAHRIL